MWVGLGLGLVDFGSNVTFNCEASPKGFTVTHINIRSLKPKIDELSMLIDEESYDVIPLVRLGSIPLQKTQSWL